MNSPWQSGQWSPQPSLDPVLVTVAPMSSTKNIPIVAATAILRSADSISRSSFDLEALDLSVNRFGALRLWYHPLRHLTSRDRPDHTIDQIDALGDDPGPSWREIRPATRCEGRPSDCRRQSRENLCHRQSIRWRFPQLPLRARSHLWDREVGSVAVG